MLKIALVTLNGLLRDKVFRGIVMIALVFLVIPSISDLSMRQVVALCLILSLSVISFILLLLSLFLGGTSLWKDMERRYSYSVLGLPIPRSSYLLGKFIGVSGFTFLTTVFLGIICSLVVWYVSGVTPPERPIVWMNIFFALLFDAQKYILLIACAFLFSTVSTSFFLPIFSAISTFFVGSASQQAYEYIKTSSDQQFSPLFKNAVAVLYYILPNFSAFDLKVNAVYGVKLSGSGLAMTFGYFVVYTSIILTLSAFIFSRREIQ